MSKHASRLRVVVASVFVAASVFGASANATQPECKAINQTTNVAYNSNAHADPLGKAIADAGSGDTLKVIGTCTGNFVITKDLTLTGRPSNRQQDVINGGEAETSFTVRAI